MKSTGAACQSAPGSVGWRQSYGIRGRRRSYVQPVDDLCNQFGQVDQPGGIVAATGFSTFFAWSVLSACAVSAMLILSRDLVNAQSCNVLQAAMHQLYRMPHRSIHTAP